MKTCDLTDDFEIQPGRGNYMIWWGPGEGWRGRRREGEAESAGLAARQRPPGLQGACAAAAAAALTPRASPPPPPPPYTPQGVRPRERRVGL
jgi:hypothetical protein